MSHSKERNNKPLIQKVLKLAQKNPQLSKKCFALFRDGGSIKVVKAWLFYIAVSDFRTLQRLYTSSKSFTNNLYKYGIRSSIAKKRRCYKKITAGGRELFEFVIFNTNAPDMSLKLEPHHYKKVKECYIRKFLKVSTDKEVKIGNDSPTHQNNVSKCINPDAMIQNTAPPNSFVDKSNSLFVDEPQSLACEPTEPMVIDNPQGQEAGGDPLQMEEKEHTYDAYWNAVNIYY
mmetsp:Transcript_12187/g.13467  ORF Transcript_12187/g.13467 Transcript_12187/m.13467 type:complete len:231 (+) Transcript_12187:1485-2177(+)